VTVRPGDTLFDLADAWLDDPHRWPEIFSLNRGTRFTDVGGTLTRAHLIRPGWELALPADATAPPSRAFPQRDTDRQDDHDVDGRPGTLPHADPDAAAPAPSTSAAPADDGLTQPSPTCPTVPSTAPTTASTTASSASSTTMPGAASSSQIPRTARDLDTSAPTHRPRTQGPSVGGVSLPTGSWIDLGLAGAVVAAVALVWAHRRRRYTPRPLSATPPTDDDLAPMPPVVTQLERGLRRAASVPQPGHHVDVLLGGPYDATDAGRLAHHDTRSIPPDGGGEDDGGRGGDGEAAEEPTQWSARRPVAAAPVPALRHVLAAAWPAGGVGLTGPGATAAARGFLIAGLTAGGGEAAHSDVSDARTLVVMPSTTAATLLGDAVAGLPTTPRLTVTAGLDDALDQFDRHTLHRSRLLDQHDAADVAALRSADPDEYDDALRPILLIADVGNRHDRARIAAVLSQGRPLDIHGVLLGDWPDGTTIHVDTDGTTTAATGFTDTADRHGTHPADVDRFTVLDPDETADLIRTLAEAHTGEPHPNARPRSARTVTHPAGDGQTAPAGAPGASQDSDTAGTPRTRHATRQAADTGADAEPDTYEDGEPPAVTAGGTAPATVQVAVLGGAAIIDADPHRRPRPQAVELLVYLAVHDGSATVDAILEDLLPDALARKATRRLHTYVSDLRGVLRHNGGPGVYVTHPKLRYALNPDAVDVDLWRMRAAITDAGRADTPEQRITALSQAVDTYRGPLADGYDYLWIEPHREAVRRQALDATTALVDALTGHPEQQLAVLRPAIALHPWTEHLYRAAMRAHHRLGHLEAIRDLRRAVTTAAADLDAEPGDDTIALADQLVADLRTSGRQAPGHPRPGAAP
jgi:DNA-binding SARP family transcriptional activator